jgi:A/G-specific adenine glycosylase
MLQQTTVAAVIPYYQRFLTAFPTVVSLSEASLDQVLELWAGLGYYSRARNLHKAAETVTRKFGGTFPAQFEGLVALPGIGRSTAGAILSIAFDQPAPILDGNVRRVLVRLFAWREDPRSSRAEKQLWAWAEILTAQNRPHDYAQAIMDLGATICTPGPPACSDCPLAELCQAFAQGLAADLPMKRKKAPVPTRHQAALIVQSSGRMLVRQRATEGLLGGMWEFPVVSLSEGEAPDQSVRDLQSDLGVSGQAEELGLIKHAYSHFKLELNLFQLQSDPSLREAESVVRWVGAHEMETLPLHGAHRKAYELFRQSR